MRGLASYVVSGRYRALIVAVASSGSLFFGWVGAAVIALITLRQGLQQGMWVLLWALLPALVLANFTGDSSTVALLIGTALLAVVLRVTVSLPMTALCSAGVALLTGLGLLLFGQALLNELAQVFEEFFAAVAAQAQRDDVVFDVVAPTKLQLAGIMGTANGALSFLCLALGRYWQAGLYNPGGFGEEFRALRLSPALVATLMVAAIAVASAGLSYRSWAAGLLLPLSIGGFAVVHASAKRRGQGGFWLGVVYLGWMIFDFAKLALIGVVAADAVLNFRSRWSAAATTKKQERRLPHDDDADDKDDE